MPILPAGSLITITNSAGPVVANVAVQSIKYKTIRKHFERAEFTHDKLLGAPNENGSRPVIQSFGDNRLVQFMSPCNPDDTVRPLTPDDDDIDNIYKRFDIKQWQCEGDISIGSEVDKLFVMARDHQVFLGRFDAYQSISRGNVSYVYLTGTLQPETFSYLTSTTISVSGNVFGAGTFTNVLITDAVADYATSIPANAADTPGTSLIYSRWSMTFEQWSLVPAASLSY